MWLAEQPRKDTAMKKSTLWLVLIFTLVLAYSAMANTSLHSYLTATISSRALSSGDSGSANNSKQTAQLLPDAEQPDPALISKTPRSEIPDLMPDSGLSADTDSIVSVTSVPPQSAGNNNAALAQPQPGPTALSPPPPQPAKPPKVQKKPTPTASYAQEMLGYINAVRAKSGLAALTLSKTLCNGAYLKSKDMAVNNYFSHTSPTYGDPFSMMKGQGITYRCAAENIAKNFSVLGSHNAFMESSGHRANILNPSFHKLGLGFYQKGDYLYVTQWFTD